MQTLVDHPSVSIKVRDASGYCVCIKCKGARDRGVFDYYNSSALLYGGLVSLSHFEKCPACDGRGYWALPTAAHEALSIPHNALEDARALRRGATTI